MKMWPRSLSLHLLVSHTITRIYTPLKNQSQVSLRSFKGKLIFVTKKKKTLKCEFFFVSLYLWDKPTKSLCLYFLN